MSHRFLPALLFLSLLLAGAIGGCSPAALQIGPSPIPVVPVSQPVAREVTDYVDFTGRTDAVEAVDIRARVTGYLIEMPFKEGAEVKKGDLLFEIDPRPYQAQLDQAYGQVNLYQAQLKLAKTTLSPRPRSLPSRAAPARSVSSSSTRTGRGGRGRGPGQGLPGQHRVYKLNLDFTKVTSPIDGQVSRYYLTRQPGQPGPDAADHRRVARPDVRLLRHGRADPAADQPSDQRGQDQASRRTRDVPVLMGLQGEEGYPAQGHHQLRQQPVNPTTGSISVRGVFPNPKPRGGTSGCCRPACSSASACRSASRIRPCWSSTGPSASDQGLKYVYVVDADNKVQYRRVQTGRCRKTACA